MSNRTKIQSVDISDGATEWYFRFENSSPGSAGGTSCDVELWLNEPYGTDPVQARLTGSFSVLVERSGELHLADFDAELSSFEVLLTDKERGTYPYDIGRLNLALDRDPPDPQPGGMMPRPNSGYIDWESGFSQVTWSVYASSPELRAIGWEPIRLVVSESGYLDLHTLKWQCLGIGVVTRGELASTRIEIANGIGPITKLMIEVPATVPSSGRTRAKLKYRDTVPLDAPRPEVEESFEISGWVARVEDSGEMQLDPGEVSLLPGSDEDVYLITRDLLPGSQVQIWVHGAGESCVGSTVVCE